MGIFEGAPAHKKSHLCCEIVRWKAIQQRTLSHLMLQTYLPQKLNVGAGNDVAFELIVLHLRAGKESEKQLLLSFAILANVRIEQTTI